MPNTLTNKYSQTKGCIAVCTNLMSIVSDIKMPGGKPNDNGKKPSPKKSATTKSPKPKGPLDFFFKKTDKPTKTKAKDVLQNDANEREEMKIKSGERLQGLSKVLKRKRDGALFELLPKDEQILHEAFDEVQCFSEVNNFFIWIYIKSS